MGRLLAGIAAVAIGLFATPGLAQEKLAIWWAKGAYKAEEDRATGEPYQETPAVLIPRAKLRKHACLRRFKLTAG